MILKSITLFVFPLVPQQLLAALATSQTQVGATVAQCISAIAQAELPMNLWPSLIPALLHNATDPASTPQLKQNTLECIGYICEEIVCLCAPFPPLVVHSVSMRLYGWGWGLAVYLRGDGRPSLSAWRYSSREQGCCVTFRSNALPL